jgi:hypothetical protein
MSQFTGTVVVRMNGLSLRSESNASMEMGGKDRNARYADHGVAGFSEKPIASKVSCNIAHAADTDLQKIADAKDVTLIFETDTGRSYTIRNAFCVKPPHLTGGEGTAAIEFQGQPAIES